jgi:SAM-dependent methyltransferase
MRTTQSASIVRLDSAVSACDEIIPIIESSGEFSDGLRGGRERIMTKMVDGCGEQCVSAQLPGAGQRLEKMQGHWVLARACKRVLRPGGLALTRRMIEALSISSDDRVVEFAPGLGVTARMVLRRKPCQYWGVEREPAAAARLESLLPMESAKIVVAQAEHSGLPDACASVIYGEAMLSMQTPRQKRRIVSEARRLLAPGGRYGIHELCFRPDGISEAMRREIEAEMSKEIHVGVQPLCSSEWKEMLEQEGFKVIWCGKADLDLLEPRRMLQDEGILRCLKIACNVLKDATLRQRILAIRRIFRRYREHLGAVSIVGRRTEQTA